MINKRMRFVAFGAIAVALLSTPSLTFAQPSGAPDSLVVRALRVSPRMRAADAQSAAARARISPAGAWADPMLMAGIQNLPLSRDAAGHGTTGGPDPMTMKMIGVSQTVPYPRKTSLRARIARADAQAAEARALTVARDLKREVLAAYYELVAARLLIANVARQQQVAASILPSAEARYVSGTAGQVDVLKARTEAAMLVDERNAASERERSALARLNAARDQPSGAPIRAGAFPVFASARQSFPPLDSMQAVALRSHPAVRERRAIIAGQVARVELASREYLPDVDVSLQYGQRDGLPDMITAQVSLPLPVQRGRKQSAAARAERFNLSTAEAELRVAENALRSDITRARAAVERHRDNVLLLERAILPQARATFASASAAYQTGRGELLGVLDAMRALFATESLHIRAQTEYATAVAELEALVGEDELR